MHTPIVLAAFGTTTNAVCVYNKFEQLVKQRFPQHPVFTAYTSRKVVRLSKTNLPQPEEILQSLYNQGHRDVVVQSLHLLPGQDFHRLTTRVNNSPLNIKFGRPLLYDENDFHNTIQAILPSPLPDESTAILLLGHGTYHPTWTMYLALEHYLKQQVGERGFSAVIEKASQSAHIIEQIKEAGFNKVLIIPILLVLGVHFRDDIIGDSPSSWTRKIKQAGMQVEAFDKGLGSLETIQHIFCQHIEKALLS